MSNELFKELSAQIIEASAWNEAEHGVIWSIEFITSQKLTGLKGDIRRKELSKVLSEAKESEDFILRYLELEKKSEDARVVDFSLSFPITKDTLAMQGTFYENLSNLYSLRNSLQIWSLFRSLITENKSFNVDFWVNKKSGRYFIKRIYIID